jgi:Flp pilus assembly protein TadG
MVRDQRGFVLAIMPFLFLALVALFAFVTSAGLILTFKHQLQAAADAGALAALSARTYEQQNDKLVEVLDEQRAEREARTLVNRNLYIMNLLDNPYRKIKAFRFEMPNEETVIVRLTGEIYLPFAKFLGEENAWKEVKVYAKAGLKDLKNKKG